VTAGWIVALAGLPGTGKSALAAELVRVTGWPVFDKDRVRAALFGPDGVEHSAAQDDFCASLTYLAATWQLQQQRSAGVVLDGRTYARPGTLLPLLALRGAVPGARLALIECHCAPDIAGQRLARDRLAGTHPAADRDAALYRRLAAVAQPLALPADVLHLRFDTGVLQPAAAATAVLAALHTAAAR